MNRQDVGNVLHRPVRLAPLNPSLSLFHAKEVDHPTSVAGNQLAVVDERAAFVPFAKMQQSRETVTFLPAQAVSPHRPVCISSRK
jgi:hypothetical protein